MLCTQRILLLPPCNYIIDMRDIFDKIKHNRGPLGQHAKDAHGYFTFPKIEGEIASRMTFNKKEVICWSINNYLGLSNHPKIRKVDADASKEWGLGTPMGSRMMSGDTKYHEELEKNLGKSKNQKKNLEKLKKEEKNLKKKEELLKEDNHLKHQLYQKTVMVILL